MIPTKASKLPTNTPKFSKSDSLPVLKIRTQPEEILIPSVQLERKSSLNDKSIDDSISYESKPSRSSSPNKKQLKGSAHSLSHPVKLANKNEIQVEVSAPKELPYTKLDILEAYLPRALRTEHSAAKKRLRLQNESDQNTLYNILKGEQAAAQLASSSLSIDSYRPTHYASGNWSSSNSINTMTDSIAPTPDHNYQLQFSIADEEFCKYAQGRGKLWESNALNGMQAREVIKKQVEDAETLARSEEIQNVINQQKELIQNKTIQKVKALNNILTTKIKLQEALEASESQLTHLPHIRQKKAKGVSDYAIQNEAFHVDFRNPNRKPDQDFDFEAYERSQMPAFRQRVISVTNNGEVGEEASYHSQNLQSNMSVSMQSENESLSSDVLKTLQDLGASEIKAKLKDLANYINSHTSRKILDCWYLIEGRFKSSTHSKNVIETDSNGLAHPVKHPAITLSALAYMLCSTKIKVGHEELQKMCSRWDFISPAHLFQARQIAAMQVVLAMHDEVKSEHYDEFKQELWQLSKGGEPLVSLQEFTDIIFDPNPEEREQQFTILKASRQDQVQAMMDEKRSKAAMKAKAAARKKQMIDDFAVALASLQLMKGVLTPNKVEEFVDMIQKSKVYIGKQKEDQAANVPQDLVLFLGLEAYPKIIQEKINAKREAREANRRNRPSDASSMSIDSSLNPFTKANIAARKGFPSNLSKPAEQSDDISVISQQSSQVALSARGESANQTRINTPNKPVSGTVGALKVHIPAYKRVLLAGPPPVLEVMKEMVSYGRGLHGLSYREAVSVLQALASTKITAMFRCYRKRWRYSAARRLWNKHFLQYCRIHFAALNKLVQHNISIRKLCWRKIIAWKYYTKRAHQRRETFRVGFWPFYVWHRYANAMGKARDKTTFLVGRVIPTLTTIKIFHAWKKYAKHEGVLNRKADGFYKQLFYADSRVLLRWLHEWSHQRHWIRRAWNTGGNGMSMRYVSRLVLNSFFIWRAYSSYRKHSREHIKTEFHKLRYILLKDKLPIRTVSNSQRRVAMKLAELKKRIKHRRATQDELKDKLKKRHRAKKDAQRKSSHAINSWDSTTSDDETASIGTIGGRDVGNPRRRSTRGGSINQAAVEIPLDFHDAVAALYQPNFTWKQNFTEIYDIDENHEENEGLTPLLLNSYQSAHISMIQNPDDFEFYHKMTKTNKQQTYIVQDSYTYNDHWNNFEASFRFHFYSYRVFKNLQYNAIKNKKVKLFMKIRKQRIKKQVMNELRHAIEVKTKRSLLVRGTEAEKLNQNVRTHQIEKIVRTRKLTNVVNSVLGRDHDDDLVDEETLRLNRIKQLNLIDIDDEEFIKNEKKRILEKQMELKRIQLEKERIFKPPNLLEIDREDREKEQKQAEDMVVFSKNTHLKTIDLVQASDTITENFRMKLNRTQDMVAEVLDSETAVTTRACTKQYEYMSAFKMHAAGALVNAMHRVYLEVQRSLMKEESKVYFRCLRLPMLLTRSKRMYFRKKLINWIRICKRLISISKKAPYYHNIRVKWVILNRWLKFISIVKLNPTPGIISFIQKKVFLLPDYNLTLERCGFEKSVYVDNNRLNQTITEFSSIFKRWKIFTQEEVLFRLLNTKIKLLYRFKILQYCFMAIKTGLNKSEYVKLLQNEITIFPIVRVLSDIEQIMKRFNAPRRKSLFTIMKKNNKKYIRYIIKDGQTSLSFKSFMTEFINNTNSRISTEQRMISDYFEIRGTQQFNDIKAPDRFHPIVPQIMQKVIGKEFFDPHEFSANGRSVTVPGGYKLTRIKFAYQYGLGIIGWQLFWTADGAMEIESPPRGSWSTASLGNNELVIPKDDFMSGLEYLYDSDVVVGVRIKLFFGGFTKWIGGKTSLSTLSVYMDCTNSCEREEYEDIRDSNLHPDEVTDPAYPYNFVIGLAGVITAGRATCLGLVIRKVVKQNLFSYSWVGDALWKAEMERTEANPLDTLPPIDLYSVPTHLSNFVPSHPVGTAVTANTAQPVDAGDSLTMSMLNSSAADSYSYDAQEGEGTEEEHNTNDDLISSVGSLHESDSQSSFPNSSTVADDDESIDSAAQNEENQEALPKPRQRRMGISNPVNNKPIAAPVKSTKEPLTSSEVQFFDVLRMRTTELSHARSRTAEFARNLWTNKNLRLDSVLCKLVVIRIVRGLSLWLFNALSKRLMPLSLSEKPALKLLRNAKVLISKADAVRNRVNMILNNANLLESSAQLWTGKHLLSPKERALKAAHHQQIAAMRAEAAKVKRDENLLRLQAVIDEKRGLAQMPKLTLSQYIVNNYRLKLAAARHKESLLERMTLEDVKTGLFGSNSKEKLLSREQMQAIHESLRGQQLKLKDVTSLERLIDGVVDEEGEIAEQQAQRTIELPRKSVRHRTDLAPMQSTVSNNRRKLSSLPPRPDGSKLNDTMALRLHNANLVNNRSRTPLVLTDRIGSPEFSSYLDQKPRGRAYSILEFNPAILPESSLTLTDSLNSPPVAEQRNKRRTSPNRRTQQARSRSVTSARSNTMMSSSHTKK